jgi:hypothetical protein
MDFDLDALIEEAVIHGEIKAGTDPRWLAHHRDPRLVVAMAGQRERCAKAAYWRKEEDEYLRRHYLFQSNEEIARHLGRSVDGVKLRMIRELRLPARSTLDDWPTMREIARRLGLSDSKSVRKWAELGLIELYNLPMGRVCRVAYWPRVVRFAVNPMHWIYFDPLRVQDEDLRRLIARQRQRWNDEWWTTGQVAAYHGVESADVQRGILIGKIQGVQWGNWHVLRSEATRPGLIFHKGKGAQNNRVGWSPGEDAFLILARALGYSWRSISEMAKYEYMQRAQHRVNEMHRQGLIADTIAGAGLRVRYNPDTGALLADWRDEAHRRRFAAMAKACERFRRGRPLTETQTVLVVGTIRAWASFYASGDEQRATARRWAYWSGNVSAPMLGQVQDTIRAWGADPFGEGESWQN